MKKFYFSLERVLDYKRQIETSLRSEHGRAVQMVKEKEAQIDALEREFEEARQSVEAAKSGEISVTKLKDLEAYIESLITRVAEEKRELVRLQEEETRKRELVIEAKKETASIQKLKDKKISTYQAMVAKSNELEIEEFISNRALMMQR